MDHRPRKRFGQHFLHDPAVIARIVAAVAPADDERILEIGPGFGAITVPLLERAGRITVVEKDRDVIPYLEENCAGHGDIRVIQGDALRLRLADVGEGRFRIVGNLPYNISTPLLFHLIAQIGQVSDMHFMLQKEVVARMASGPGDTAYGRLSVMLAAHVRVERLFDIGRGAFSPPPRVDSSFCRLTPWPEPPFPLQDRERFAALVNRAFQRRRKTLRNALRDLVEPATMEALGIDPSARPETLSAEEFARLADSRGDSGKL